MKHPPQIIVQLVHIAGPRKGEIQEFSDAMITIGREPSCLVRFAPDLTIVSRHHADIVREGNRFKVTDHSANGTFVNGKRVQEAYLKNGDVLELAEGGPKVSFLSEIKHGIVEQQPVEPAQPRSLIRECSAPFLREKPGESEKPVPSYQEINEVQAPLIVQYGPTIRSFKKLPVTIGTNPRCELILNHPAIMDEHARISFNDQGYWIKDLTGRNFITINGKAIGDHALLRPNDQIALSRHGPVFRFLGEGRLAEVSESPGDQNEEKSEAPARGRTQNKKQKNLLSKFKKYLGDK